METIGLIAAGALVTTLVGLMVTALWRVAGLLARLPLVLDRLNSSIAELRDDLSELRANDRDLFHRIRNLERNAP